MEAGKEGILSAIEDRIPFSVRRDIKGDHLDTHSRA